ncbi:restriction endonuclease subunit S [Thermonema rossianum]|uniref:restriction endonuclease subunit S n=1 Tax=Thermonema rossianum TaxID=55505 RepID=UPI000689476B|nr:restriction endonuclease subunit S [Thermonema rossianum]
MKTKTNKTALIPKLRFPEFQNSGEWEVVLLEKLIFKNTKRNSEKKYSLVQSISNKHGFINQDEYFDNRQVASMDTSKYYVVDKGTFAYNPSRIDVGSLAYKNDDNISIISPLYVCFKCNREIINDYFLLHWFDTNSFKKQMTTNIEGGVRNTLNFENLIRISIPLPTLPEQQKIAAFLSNLDEWLAAEEEKLTLLETYKKGLLQNLFPAEGETVPKLRFPEFQNSGAWEVKRLGEVASSLMYGINAAATEFDGENIYIRITDIDEESRQFLPNPLTSPKGELQNKYLVNVGDILIARTGASVGKSYYHKNGFGKAYFAGFLIRVSIKKDFIPFFVYLQTLTKKYNKWIVAVSVRSGQPGINIEQLKSYSLFIPPSKAEQQKIADCLSALDELIEAQRQKIEQLREHKKGLLQQLFPMGN